MAGSRELEPYTAVVDLSTIRRTDGAFWHAARSCIVPMTFISFIAERPPDEPGLAESDAWTTVSTDAVEMTFAIRGLRMSARTNSARPIRRSRSRGGGTVSTASTRSIAGFAARRAARWPPRKRLTPVTSTTEGVMALPQEYGRMHRVTDARPPRAAQGVR
jgi:hypothetical protein